MAESNLNLRYYSLERGQRSRNLNVPTQVFGTRGMQIGIVPEELRKENEQSQDAAALLPSIGSFLVYSAPFNRDVKKLKRIGLLMLLLLCLDFYFCLGFFSYAFFEADLEVTIMGKNGLAVYCAFVAAELCCGFFGVRTANPRYLVYYLALVFADFITAFALLFSTTFLLRYTLVVPAALLAYFIRTRREPSWYRSARL